jgi:hypothetical protein
MRSAGNFSPEWGYLAPAPSFARTARVVLVATAIGATAGAGVVLSLIDRSGEPEKTPTAARAIVTSVRTAAVPSIAAVAPATPVAPATTAPPAATVAKPFAPALVAAAPPPEKPNNSARISSRATRHNQAAVPAANTPAPAPAAPSAAASANATPKESLPDTPASTPAIAPPAVTPTADAGSVVSAPVAATAPAAVTASAAATAVPAEPPKVIEAAPADAPDNTAIVAPEPAAPPKKTKRHASAKPAPFAGIGSVLRRVFASHGGRSYYPQ